MSSIYPTLNMIDKCRKKTMFVTVEDAQRTAIPGMRIYKCPVCLAYHKTSQAMNNHPTQSMTPDEVVEAFR